MNITKITIGRLFNLGSYEHVRYELTAEVPAGESPATALIGLEKIITALNPKMPTGCISVEEEERRNRIINEMDALGDEEFRSLYLWGENTTRADYMRETIDDLVKGVEQRKEWEARSVKARKLLEDLGGAANWRDAKEDWDNE